jgi:tape measure domain-containing protein
MIAGSIEIQLLANIARLQSDMDKANRTVSGAMQKIEASAKMAMRAVGGIVGAIGIRELVQATDTYTKFTAQLKLATRSADEYAQAYRNVQRISRDAQVDISATAQIYARLSNALRDAGASQKQISDISETISLALRVNGATATETASAMLQLAQAFGSGRLAGEEFRAVSEAAPGLLRELARAIGVPVGALKEMAKEGKLTSDVLANAWANPAYLEGLREQAKEVRTISSAIVVLKNNFITLLGEMDKANGVSANVANGILFLADKMAFLADMVYGTIEVFKQFGRSLAVVFNDIKTFGQVASMSMNVVQALLNKDKIAQVLKEREEFNKAANADLEKFINGNFRRFRDAMVESREEAAKPYDTTPLKTFGAELDKAAAKAENLRNKQILQDLQDEINFEEEMRETRAKIKYEEAVEAKKQLEKDEKYRTDFIMKRNQEISDEYLRTVKEQNDKAQREYDRFYDRLSQSITDALFRGFESGKDFIQNFKDTLIRAFQTLILQPRIEMIVKGSGIGALFGVPGVANAAIPGGGIGGGFSGLGDLWNIGKGLFDGFSGVQSAITGGIEKLGVMLATGNGGLLDSLGGFIGANAGTIGNVLPFAGAALQAFTGNLKGAAFTAAGAALGSVIPGIGTALGGAVGGLVGSLFGGEDIPMIGSRAVSKYVGGQLTSRNTAYGDKKLGADAAVKGLTGAFASTLGGLLGEFGLNDTVASNSILRKRTNVRGFFNAAFEGGKVRLSEKYGKDADIGKSFEKMVASVMGPLLVQAIRKSKLDTDIKSLFDGISSQSDVQAMIAAAVNLKQNQEQLTKVYDLTAESAARAGRLTGATGAQLVELLKKMTDAANAYKTVGEVLVEAQTSLVDSLSVGNANSLPATLKAFDDILKSIDKSAPGGIEKFSDLFMIRDQFAAYRQSVDSLKGNVRGALFGMASPAEQQAMMQADLAKMFAELGRDVPGSIEELINLGKSIDYTTKEGLDLAAVFPSLVQAFQQTRGQVDGLLNSLGQLDINRFRTLVDYTRAQRYVDNGIPLSSLPSYDVGTSFVPKDGPAMIHRGERILTASENKSLTVNLGSLVAEVRQLRDENQRLLVSIIQATQKTAKVMQKIDDEGVVLSEINNDGERVVLDVRTVS